MGNWRVPASDAVRQVSEPAPAAAGLPRPKLLFVVTEDWYFCSHRLPVARAARDAGFAVAVATRVSAHGAAIRAEGFALHPLAWRRRGDGLLGGVRAVFALARLYRRERPDILHHVALKPVVFGGLACRLAFAGGAAPFSVASVMGLGSGFTATGMAARLRRPLLRLALRIVAGRGKAIVQNAQDRAVLASLGVAPDQVRLIRGSGVDVTRFVPLPEPEGEGVTIALVGRMLRAKGVLDAVAAVHRLREQGFLIELLLAGAPDSGNPDSLDAGTLARLGAEPGISWLGSVGDIRQVWRRAAIAVLPSTYGEGLPKALIEAAACARPIVANDVPGCREAVRDGANGLLVPPRDINALATAIAALARDPARRRAMGEAGRALAESEFAQEIVARETLAIYSAALSRCGGAI